MAQRGQVQEGAAAPQRCHSLCMPRRSGQRQRSPLATWHVHVLVRLTGRPCGGRRVGGVHPGHRLAGRGALTAGQGSGEQGARLLNGSSWQVMLA